LAPNPNAGALHDFVRYTLIRILPQVSRRSGHFKHSLSDSRLETISDEMKARCYNPKADNYARYVEKGHYRLRRMA
jgi:hypothetical protein